MTGSAPARAQIPLTTCFSSVRCFLRSMAKSNGLYGYAAAPSAVSDGWPNGLDVNGPRCGPKPNRHRTPATELPAEGVFRSRGAEGSRTSPLPNTPGMWVRSPLWGANKSKVRGRHEVQRGVR